MDTNLTETRVVLQTEQGGFCTANGGKKNDMFVCNEKFWERAHRIDIEPTGDDPYTGKLKVDRMYCKDFSTPSTPHWGTHCSPQITKDTADTFQVRSDDGMFFTLKNAEKSHFCSISRSGHMSCQSDRPTKFLAKEFHSVCEPNEIFSERGHCAGKPWDDFLSCAEEARQGACEDGNSWVEKHCPMTCARTRPIPNDSYVPLRKR